MRGTVSPILKRSSVGNERRVGAFFDYRFDFCRYSLKELAFMSFEASGNPSSGSFFYRYRLNHVLFLDQAHLQLYTSSTVVLRLVGPRNSLPLLSTLSLAYRLVIN